MLNNKVRIPNFPFIFLLFFFELMPYQVLIQINPRKIAFPDDM